AWRHARDAHGTRRRPHNDGPQWRDHRSSRDGACPESAADDGRAAGGNLARTGHATRGSIQCATGRLPASSAGSADAGSDGEPGYGQNSAASAEAGGEEELVVVRQVTRRGGRDWSTV